MNESQMLGAVASLIDEQTMDLYSVSQMAWAIEEAEIEALKKAIFKKDNTYLRPYTTSFLAVPAAASVGIVGYPLPQGVDFFAPLAATFVPSGANIAITGMFVEYDKWNQWAPLPFETGTRSIHYTFHNNSFFYRDSFVTPPPNSTPTVINGNFWFIRKPARFSTLAPTVLAPIQYRPAICIAAAQLLSKLDILEDSKETLNIIDKERRQQ